jgi:prepilin-type N-terminal cleavage/methylation domain-containing protein
MTVLKSPRGVTLIEMAVALAVLAIISALGFAALSEMRPRMDLNSMSAQFAAATGEAQARALRSQQVVWLIVYVDGPDASTENGGYVIYEPLSGAFDWPTYSVVGSALPHAPGDVVASQVWFRPEITSGRVRFAHAGADFPLAAPFAGTAQRCSFCTASADGLRGAMVFAPDGEVTFRDGTAATPLPISQGVVTLSSDLDIESTRAAIAVSATGLTRVTKP